MTSIVSPAIGQGASVARVSTDHALQLLKDAGLSGYEAKAYLALLAAGSPMNGYEVAKASGVPRSTVYETLGKLVARGTAFEVSDDSGSVSYAPLPSDALIGRLRRSTHETIVGLETVLPSIGAALAARVVQHVTGRSDVISRAVDVIESARRTLWLSIWPHESDEFVGAVHGAVERGVDVFTIAYGNVGDFPGRVYGHSYSAPDIVEERLQCRLSIVVADHEQALIGGVTTDAVWGMWSDDRAVALLAAEHVRHDIALQLTAERLEAAGLHDFWTHNEDLEALRDASAAAMVANVPEIR
ncbi:MAG: helix-turn-helix domain-containing protein [Ilumatobacteraceae bacterium]